MSIHNRTISGVREAGRLQLKALYTTLAANPRTMGAAAALAVTAPLFLKNEERGYFKTAGVTTPLIAAGAMVVPQLLKSALVESRRGTRFAKSVAQDVFEGIPDFEDMVRFQQD